MKISIQHQSTTDEYNVHWNETIKELKQKACHKEGLLVESLDLVLDGKTLDNDEQLCQTGVFDHDHPDIPILQLVER